MLWETIQGIMYEWFVYVYVGSWEVYTVLFFWLFIFLYEFLDSEID